MPENYSKTINDSYYSSMTKHQWDSTNGTDSTVSYDRSNTLYSRTFNGSYNPRWKNQIRLQQNATTTASGSQKHVAADVFISKIRGFRYSPLTNTGPLGQEDYGYPYLSGLWAHESLAPADIVTSVTNRAIMKFLEKADAVRSSFEAGQDIGELKQTIHGILHPMQAMRDLSVKYLEGVMKRTRKLKQVKAISKAVADSYLEYRFGWRPLALDIADAYASLTNNSHFDTVPITASATDYFRLNNGTLWSPISGGDYSSLAMYKVVGTYTVRLKGAIKTNATGGKISLAQNLQLDLPHFLPTIWDLLPYSWMIDYFANIGDIIKAYSFRSSDLAWGCKTLRTTRQYSWSYGPLSQNIVVPNQISLTLLEQPTGSASARSVTFSRGSIGPDELIPRFQFQIPLSSRPWENIGALLTSKQNSISRFFSGLFGHK
jgi:hypothetical protein